MGIKEHGQSVHNKMVRIRDLHEKRGKLFDELEESLALRTIWPEVFDHGQVKCRIDGFLIAPAKAKLIIENGIGETRKLLLKDAPRGIRSRLIEAFAPKDAYGFRNFFKRLDREEDCAKEAENQESDGRVPV